MGLQNDIKSLPEDIVILIHYHLHRAKSVDIFEKIHVFKEIQTFWELFKGTLIMCVLDYIEENTHTIFSQFYTSDDGSFERPELGAFIDVVEIRLDQLVSFDFFEEYYMNELRMLFGSDVLSYVWLGYHLQNSIQSFSDVLYTSELYNKFGNTPVGKQIPYTIFKRHILEEKNSIRREIMQLYYDPDFQIF